MLLNPELVHCNGVNVRLKFRRTAPAFTAKTTVEPPVKEKDDEKVYRTAFPKTKLYPFISTAEEPEL